MLVVMQGMVGTLRHSLDPDQILRS